MEQQKAHSQQRNGLGIALVGRLAHILSASSFFAIYIYIYHIYISRFGNKRVPFGNIWVSVLEEITVDYALNKRIVEYNQECLTCFGAH